MSAAVVAAPVTGTRFVRAAAIAGAAGALISVATVLLPATGLSGQDGAAWTSVNLLTDVLMLVGLAGFASIGAARGWLARIGLTAAFAGLGLFAVIDVLIYSGPDWGERLHPISVPLTGVGMLITGIATLRTGRWSGWARFAPLACGLTPFLIELPGFITQGDTPALGYFIAATWTAWLIMFAALAADRSAST